MRAAQPNRLSPFLVLALGLLWSTVADAGESRQTAKMVGETLSRHQALLGKYPPLSLIDGAVRRDCAVRNADVDADGAFCRCGSAVTMQLWLSGLDPNMPRRLNDFLQAPSEQAADGFVRYQGPELYAPLCATGERK